VYPVSYIVTTPLVDEVRCDSRAQVTHLIRDYLEGKREATLSRIRVVEVLGSQPAEDGIDRDPALFSF
jgi:hypothetical protein